MNALPILGAVLQGLVGGPEGEGVGARLEEVELGGDVPRRQPARGTWPQKMYHTLFRFSRAIIVSRNRIDSVAVDGAPKQSDNALEAEKVPRVRYRRPCTMRDFLRTDRRQYRLRRNAGERSR